MVAPDGLEKGPSSKMVRSAISIHGGGEAEDSSEGGCKGSRWVEVLAFQAVQEEFVYASARASQVSTHLVGSTVKPSQRDSGVVLIGLFFSYVRNSVLSL